MEENNAESSPGEVPESPRPLAFTIDFGDNKTVDVQRQKALAEKFQKRHKRVQSLSKIEDGNATPQVKHPLTGNLPRKSSFQSDGYFSSDEKPERVKSANARVSTSTKRSDLTLFLKNVTTDRMTQSFPSSNLPSITSPEIELKDISSPEFDLISPFSPKEQSKQTSGLSNKKEEDELAKLYVKDPEKDQKVNIFVESVDFDFDKSDTASDAGTYTLDADNYSEEQKARMSIDKEFKIEHVSVQKKTAEYVKSLCTLNESGKTENGVDAEGKLNQPSSSQKITKKQLSPIMSPTQNLSITESAELKPNDEPTTLNNNQKMFMKIMFPSPNAKRDGLSDNYDQGSVISVTSSGAFKPKIDKKLERRYSLTKSEIQVQAYVDNKSYTEVVNEPVHVANKKPTKLSANIVNVQSIEVNTVIGKLSNLSPNSPSRNLPPAVGGKTSPTKIPSPVHTLSPRTKNGSSTSEYSDHCFDTDLILKPTQNYINSLQQRLSLDSDQDSDYDIKCGLQLNNTAHLLKQKASHTRHNSLDDRAMNISNKLEHFQNKNLQGIDQTYTNLFNQYTQNKVMQKVQNSPNNSPIRRSTSFSNKNLPNKNTNVMLPQKEFNVCNSPIVTRNSSIQRSSSTASIKPNYIGNRRPNLVEHQRIDRSQFADTESSSEEDFEKNMQKRKDLTNITNTRSNRTLNLRRARADSEMAQLKCPNTPEMRRKSFDIKHEQRAISVDRKPMKTNDVQSRYLLNITKNRTPPPSAKLEKNVPKTGNAPNKNKSPQAFSRLDTGRASMRTNITTKPPTSNSTSKGFKKDASGKKQSGARSNSSLSSKEVEFQNWKRRKSYDPMKAAAEGKKKEMAKRQGLGMGHNMTQSYTEANHSQDSSPSHSSSVHRSQSFHGTAALEQLLSSEEEEDLTLSADEGFSPPTPSPCELSPARASLRHALWERIRH